MSRRRGGKRNHADDESSSSESFSSKVVFGDTKVGAHSDVAQVISGKGQRVKHGKLDAGDESQVLQLVTKSDNIDGLTKLSKTFFRPRTPLDKTLLANLLKRKTFEYGDAETQRRLAAKMAGITQGKAVDLEAHEEAIIRITQRPAFLVNDHKIEIPAEVNEGWKDKLSPFLKNLEAFLPAVGRINLDQNPSYRWAGTGWLVKRSPDGRKGIIVTNRHVVELFTELTSDGKLIRRRNPIAQAKKMIAKIDFREESKTNESEEFMLGDVLFIHEQYDLALIEIEEQPRQQLPQPIPLSSRAITEHDVGRMVAVVGYPAADSRRNPDPVAVKRIFAGIYDVKRFQPGEVIDGAAGDFYFKHDCSTLGGNSGSVVLDIETGEAVGLHFLGAFLDANYAIRTNIITSALERDDIRRACL